MRHPVAIATFAAVAALSTGSLLGCGPECGGGSLNLALTNHSTNFNGTLTPYQPGRVTGRMSADRGSLTINARLCADDTANRTLAINVSACGGPGQPCCGMTCTMGTACTTPPGGTNALCLDGDPMVQNALGASCSPTGGCPQNSTCTQGFCMSCDQTTITAGSTFAVNDSTEANATTMVYEESGVGPWRGRSGWVQIDSIDGANVTLHVNSVLFMGDSTGTATGTFTFDGTGRVDGVSGL